MKLKSIITVALFTTACVTQAQPYGPYNQQYTINQQYGSTNWYSSPLGMGAAQAGVTLIGGLVNAMSRPDPVVVQQQAPIYVNGGGGYGAGYQGSGRCSIQTVFDQAGNARSVNICP
jgi:hypothetical protein